MTPLQKLVKASTNSAFGRYLVYAFQLISLIILSRIFSPEDFGSVAVLQVISTFFILLGEMGIGSAIIEKKNLSKNQIDGIYTITWIVGIITSLVFLLIIPLYFATQINRFEIIIPIAISASLACATSVPLALLQRETAFIKISKCEVAAELSALIGVIVLSNYISPTAALVEKILIYTFIRKILLLISTKRTSLGMPKIRWDTSAAREVFQFSKFQFLFNIANYFSRNLDSILVGKLIGTHDLGIYDKSYQLMRYPLMLLTFAISPAIQPTMKELRGDTQQFEVVHNKFIMILSLGGTLVGVLVFFLSNRIVEIILGNQWGQVTPLLKILSITIPIQMVLSSSGGFFLAAGRPDLLLKSGIFSSITNTISITIGATSGNLQTLCWCIAISFFINLIYTYLLMGKNIMPSGSKYIFAKLTPSFVLNLFFVYHVHRTQ